MLTGGGGADTFLYDADAEVGDDLILDFANNTDAISLDVLFDFLNVETVDRGVDFADGDHDGDGGGNDDTIITLTDDGAPIAPDFSITVLNMLEVDLATTC